MLWSIQRSLWLIIALVHNISWWLYLYFWFLNFNIHEAPSTCGVCIYIIYGTIIILLMHARIPYRCIVSWNICRIGILTMLEEAKYVGTNCNLICWNIVNHARFNELMIIKVYRNMQKKRNSGRKEFETWKPLILKYEYVW